MRKDPSFAEKVTQAIAERLGPVPDASVNAIASRLDAKVQDLWVKHQPSPWLHHLNLGLKGLGVLGLAAAGFWGFHHWAIMNHPAPTASEQGQVATTHSTSQVVEVPKPSSAKIGKKSHSRVEPAARVETGSAQEDPQAGKAPQETLEATSSKPRLQGDNAPEAVLSPQTKGNMTSARGDALRVAVHSDKLGFAIITVYDGNGNLVRHLFQGPVEAGDRYVDWDGKDDQGTAVASGSYNVVLDLNGKKMSGVLKILPR
jgi:hypothetical protein